MKFIVAFRDNGLHKSYKIDDEHKWGHVVDLKIGSEFDGEKILGEAYKGYVLRITGGTDENGFPMKNGVLRKTRARLLIPPRTCGLRTGREGERKRRSEGSAEKREKEPTCEERRDEKERERAEKFALANFTLGESGKKTREKICGLLEGDWREIRLLEASTKQNPSGERRERGNCKAAVC